ncbi:MAG: nodulation protein NfeD [Actinomycetota bacterium]|nr:nodulation protein NfeD [Actinomycetota bacterium]
MQKNNKLFIFLIFAILIFLFTAAPVYKSSQEGTNNSSYEINNNNGKDFIEISNFFTCEVTGIIDPPISNYVTKCLQKSHESGYGLIILMNTPGGLETSMREIITEILNTDIPVIVFIYPKGSRAASAGTFITYSADLAAMAPLTSIGAAHPVNLGGDQQVSGDILDKVTNDSVSYIKNLAISKDRNPKWAEKAVRESASITAEEALELGVIELTALDTEELLKKIDGKIIDKSGSSFLIRSDGSTAEKIDIDFITSFLHTIVNPNIAYLLFIIGIFGLIYEFSQPGLGISGAVGILFIILGLYSFSILPINYAGLALIILAIILFIIDIIIGSGGILSIAGVASLVIGSFLLINTGASYLKITRSLILSASLVVSGFIIIVIRAAYRAHQLKPATGKEEITGKTAVVCQDLNPGGMVKVSGEIWKAVSINGKKIKKGRKVRIISLEGLTLMVNLLNKNKNKNKK